MGHAADCELDGIALDAAAADVVAGVAAAGGHKGDKHVVAGVDVVATADNEMDAAEADAVASGAAADVAADVVVVAHEPGPNVVAADGQRPDVDGARVVDGAHAMGATHVLDTWGLIVEDGVAPEARRRVAGPRMETDEAASVAAGEDSSAGVGPGDVVDTACSQAVAAVGLEHRPWAAGAAGCVVPDGIA